MVKFILFQNNYTGYLNEINGIRFSNREIDVIAGVINGRSAKTIASLLYISPKTVEVHINNIKVKINCNSRENMIDFVEKSEKLILIRQHYQYLITQANFEKSLKKISRLIKNKELTCSIFYEYNQTNQAIQVERCLNIAGIKVFLNMFQNLETKHTNFIIYIIPRTINTPEKVSHFQKLLQKANETPKNIIFLLWGENPTIEILKELSNVRYINFNNEKNNYFNIFEIIKHLVPSANLNEIESEFNKLYSILNLYSNKEAVQKDYTQEIEGRSIKNKKIKNEWFYIVVGFFLSFLWQILQSILNFQFFYLTK